MTAVRDQIKAEGLLERAFLLALPTNPAVIVRHGDGPLKVVRGTDPQPDDEILYAVVWFDGGVDYKQAALDQE